jgi:hypothetical protein
MKTLLHLWMNIIFALAVPMFAEQHIDAAMAALNGEAADSGEEEVQDSDEAAGAGAGAGAAGAGDGEGEGGEGLEAAGAGEGGEAGEEEQAEVEEDPNALPEELKDHPRILALTKAEEHLQAFTDTLADSEYPIEFDAAKPEEAMKEVALRLNDAHVLYEIINGKTDPSALFDVLESEYPRGVYEGVMQRIVNYVVEKGLVQAAGEEEDGEAGDLKDPLEKKIAELSAEVKRLKKGGAADPAAERDRNAREAATRDKAEKTRVFGEFTKKVEALAAKAGLDKELVPDYVNAISRMVGGKRPILQRIAKGNFVDVEKSFTEYHNRMTRLFAGTQNKRVATKTSRDQQVPKTPAGGAPPVSGGKEKRNLLDRDSRLAAVTEQL